MKLPVVSTAALAFATPALVDSAAIRILDPSIAQITRPTGSTVWKIGATERVTWDASSPFEYISKCVHITLKGGSLAKPVTLASALDLKTGFVEITLPSNITPGTYMITLYGEYIDLSPPFEIE